MTGIQQDITKGTVEAKLLFTYFTVKKHFYFIFNFKISKRWTNFLPRLVLGQCPKREVDIGLNTVYLAIIYNGNNEMNLVRSLYR